MSIAMILYTVGVGSGLRNISQLLIMQLLKINHSLKTTFITSMSVELKPQGF